MASKRAKRRRSCEGKRRYGDHEAADHASRVLRAVNDGGSWVSYFCHYCGGWHVGRRTKEQKRALFHKMFGGE